VPYEAQNTSLTNVYYYNKLAKSIKNLG